MNKCNSAAMLCILLSCFWSSKANAQTSPSIVIIAPKNETVVQPGQTLQVTADSAGVVQVAIVGTNPIGTTSLQTGSSSLSFSLLLPANLRAGRYYLTGVGTATGGALVQSSPVSILVQTAGILALQVSPNPLMLRVAGSQMTLDVQAKTTQGQMTMDPQTLQFLSNNTGVASVDVNGVVTGQSPGTAQITASYSVGGNVVSGKTSAVVGGGVLGDLNGDGRVDIDDVNILDGALNNPANGPNDARDLNHDGVINALDARLLTTLCTYPRCATHP